jgi:hypothetical protein
VNGSSTERTAHQTTPIKYAIGSLSTNIMKMSSQALSDTAERV